MVNLFKKKNGLVIFITVLILMLCLMVSNVNMYAATTGEILPTPEAGWQRIDSSSPAITSNDQPVQSYGFDGSYYHICYANDYITFKFKGTKLRIITARNNDVNYANGGIFNITIDGVTEQFTTNGYLAYCVISYENLNLSNSEHMVTIQNPTGGCYGWIDAIDIDESGYLVDLNQPNNLIATPDDSLVNLSWGVITGATGYNVKRATAAGGPYTTIATGVEAIIYSDSDVTNGITYYYVVSSLVNGVESSASNEVSATPAVESVDPVESSFIITTTIPGTLSSWSDNYGPFFIAPYACEVVSVREIHVGSALDTGSVTLDVEKLTGIQSPDSGVTVLNSIIDLKGAPNTVQEPVLTTTTANLQLAEGDRLSLKDLGKLSGASGVSLTIELKKLN